MKKYVILTSVLALAACGGGSGGGSAVVPTIDGPRAANLIGTTTTADNANITSMASAVVVKNGGGWSSVARSATAPDTTTYSGYTVYKLDNVDFKLIEDADSAFNFSIDENGRINRVTTRLSGTEGSADRDTTNTAQFNGAIFQFIKPGSDREVITVVDDGQMTQTRLDAIKAAAVSAGKLTSAEASAGQWNHLIQKWEFEHSNRADGLTYSDFGYMKTTNVEKQKNVTVDNTTHEITAESTSTNPNESRLVFAGGYDIANTPETGMEFSGKAIGVVTSSVLTDNSSLSAPSRTTYGHSDVDEMAVLSTSDAHLVFNEGNEVLVLPFGSNGTATDVGAETPENVAWYDVTVTKNHNTNDATFTFDDGDRTIPVKFQTEPGNTNVTTDKSIATMGYYGVGTPSEATGAVEYMTTKDLSPSDDTSRDIREFHFQAGYGLKKD